MYARYTEVLRNLMMDERAKACIDQALSTYPLYTPKTLIDLIPTREELNTKLLNHYKYREIGFETIGRFVDELEITMCEIMPRYNELFKTVEIMAELPSPFDNVDVTETFEQETSANSRSNGSNSQTSSNTNTNKGISKATLGNKANSKQLDSDTPQDELAIATDDIDSVSYASNANWNEAISEGSEQREVNDTATSQGTLNGSSNGTSESTGTTRHTFTKKGNQGVNTYAHDMNEFRTSIIDVVDQIINDERVNELFMMVY